MALGQFEVIGSGGLEIKGRSCRDGIYNFYYNCKLKPVIFHGVPSGEDINATTSM